MAGRRRIPLVAGLAALLVLALATGGRAAADEVADAQAKVNRAAAELDRLRAEYAVLAEHASGAADNLEHARLRTVTLQRQIDEGLTTVSDAQVALRARARRAYMGDPLTNINAILRVTDDVEMAIYLPYVTKPIELDRQAVAVYRQRVAALQDLQADLDAARRELSDQAGNLGAVEAKLTANLNAQHERLAQARGELRAAEDRKAQAEADARAADAARATATPVAGTVLHGPQSGSGPGPGAGIEVIEVPPAPRELPNGVSLGPTAGIPPGLQATGIPASGVASWYGPGFHGFQTANGETYDQYGFTVAHKSLPFNTILIVSFRDRSVLVRVNDRGPYVDGRVLDLSKGAADALGLTGIGHVEAEILLAV